MADASKVIDYDFTRSTLAAAALVGPTLSFTRTTEARRFDSAGVLQTSASGSARLASHVYDGTGWVNKGYLVEEQRTNVCLHSEDLGNAAWVDNTATIATNVLVAPDGATTMDTLEDDSASGPLLRSQNITIADDSTSHVVSVFVPKVVSPTFFPSINLRLTGGTQVQGILVLDTENGTGSAPFGSPNDPDDFGVEDAGDFWRFYVVMANNGTGNTTAVIQLYPASSDDLAGNFDNGALGTTGFWGMQLENAAFPTSYIPTTTVAVTRNKDVAQNTTGIAALMNQAAGTIMAEVFLQDDQTAHRLCSLRASGIVMRFYQSSAISHLRYNGTTGGNDFNILVSGALDFVGVDRTIAGAMQLNDAQVAYNGALQTADTSVDVYTADFDTLQVGCDQSVGQINGYIKTFAYFDVRKNDAFLQSPDLARGGGGTAIFASELL